MNNQLTLFDRDSDYLESSVKDFDSKTASFRVHASLIYKLGESLIADEITALSELIKNAYDADATVCALSISSDYIEEIDGKECTGCIELSDNGCGMDLTTIVNGWLTLSNSPKKKMKKEQKTTPKYHRYPLGDKGLGRLSVQKIGRYMEEAQNPDTDMYRIPLGTAKQLLLDGASVYRLLPGGAEKIAPIAAVRAGLWYEHYREFAVTPENLGALDRLVRRETDRLMRIRPQLDKSQERRPSPER